MAIETDTVTMPAFWACALINGDQSGMTDAEVGDMDCFLSDLVGDGWSVVDVGEPWFTWSFRLYGGSADGGDVADYTVIRAARDDVGGAQ